MSRYVVVECRKPYPERPDVPPVILYRTFLGAPFVLPVSGVSPEGLGVHELELYLVGKLTFKEHGVKSVVNLPHPFDGRRKHYPFILHTFSHGVPFKFIGSPPINYK